VQVHHVDALPPERSGDGAPHLGMRPRERVHTQEAAGLRDGDQLAEGSMPRRDQGAVAPHQRSVGRPFALSLSKRQVAPCAQRGVQGAMADWAFDRLRPNGREPPLWWVKCRSVGPEGAMADWAFDRLRPNGREPPLWWVKCRSVGPEGAMADWAFDRLRPNGRETPLWWVKCRSVGPEGAMADWAFDRLRPKRQGNPLHPRHVIAPGEAPAQRSSSSSLYGGRMNVAPGSLRNHVSWRLA
jgi:hypothetical protein